MKFSIDQAMLLEGLHFVTGVTERRHPMPILANVLLKLKADQLVLIGTDIDIELISQVPVQQVFEVGETTVSAKKLMDICRLLPSGESIMFEANAREATLSVHKSVFRVMTLPSENFPVMPEVKDDATF